MRICYTCGYFNKDEEYECESCGSEELGTRINIPPFDSVEPYLKEQDDDGTDLP
ncbi:hypothetical protein LCGC14_0383110 [marine sediment metagenome]|uniref:Uncharacterized protein n=1 Tax=marine sediment metagenome TaxID=412755 RepID=A0A0F9TJR8_9ZZZZ